MKKQLTDIVKNFSVHYVPDTYAKISMYLPIMATMELSTGKTLKETAINRIISIGTDFLNGTITGIACDYARRVLHTNGGVMQRIADTATSIIVLDTLYFAYQNIACAITDRPTDTIIPACINLSWILLATGATYGKKRDVNRVDYFIEGNRSERFGNMIKNDYHRIMNWAITDLWHCVHSF